MRPFHIEDNLEGLKKELELDVHKVALDTLFKRYGTDPTYGLSTKQAKVNYERTFYSSLRTISGKANQLNSYNTIVGDPGYIDEDLARYMNVDAAGVQTTASSTVTAGSSTPRSERKESQATSITTRTARGRVRWMSSSMRRASSALA